MSNNKHRRTLPRLPKLLDRKIYKTGQTRGADDDEIFQNRVSRSSTVLIPYPLWVRYLAMLDEGHIFERGYIVLISPSEYFEKIQCEDKLAEERLVLGMNAVVFYETRNQWNIHNPEALGWEPAESRLSPLGGKYIARISATTSLDNGGKIIRGFSATSNKGAGIRVYEYANSTTVVACRYQLEALFWLCIDAETVAVQNGMLPDDVRCRKSAILQECESQGLLDKQQLMQLKIISNLGYTTCPLCLEEISSQGFFLRMEQSEGRAVLDLTVTQINLFHIEELKFWVFNHRPYNLGWGHHHCNVVVKDAGIRETIEWMDEVVQRNIDAGHFMPTNRGNPS